MSLRKIVKRGINIEYGAPKNDPVSKEREVIASKLGIPTILFKKIRRAVPNMITKNAKINFFLSLRTI